MHETGRLLVQMDGEHHLSSWPSPQKQMSVDCIRLLRNIDMRNSWFSLRQLKMQSAEVSDVLDSSEWALAVVV